MINLRDPHISPLLREYLKKRLKINKDIVEREDIKMGYYTNFELEINAGPHDIKDIVEAIKEIEDANDALCLDGKFYITNDGNYEICGYEPTKWYDVDFDMSEISKQFPSAEFIIYGEGEERDDTWKHKYINGKMYEQKMAIVWGNWKEI